MRPRGETVCICLCSLPAIVTFLYSINKPTEGLDLSYLHALDDHLALAILCYHQIVFDTQKVFYLLVVDLHIADRYCNSWGIHQLFH